MGWNSPLATLGQLSCVCPLPAPAAPPACPLAGQSAKLQSPWLSVSTALRQLKHQRVINIILSLNAKHSTTPARRRKINSILAETRTLLQKPAFMERGQRTVFWGIGLPWDGICLLAWLQGWPWDLCEGTPWLSDPLRALLQLWESLMNVVTPARSSAVLLLLEQLSAPRAHQQLCFLQVLLCFTSSQNKVGKERAMERIWRLIGFISTRFHHEPIGKYFQSSQRTTIVLRTLETIRDCCIDDNKNQWAKFTLEVAARDSASWLMDVERILRFLHENLKRSDSTSLLRQSFFLVLKALTNQFPREALISVLTNLPPLDSTTLDMWKVMLSFPMTSEKILQELQNVLQDKRVCGSLQARPVHTSLLKFAMMHPTEHVLSNLRDPKKLLTLLSLNSLPILWLVLRALVMLSETSQMVTDVQVLLPEVMETLQYENTHINMKALTIFKNVIRHLEKKEASPIALALAGRLLPLFNDRLLQCTPGT
ncbi:uncharacterized protein [Anas platyrhynchos]|uniref:uncharacterized protein isoform X1 n=1 Tax=Anas platyrhynchos TaxID=8839 RepID=UPI003AF24E81